MLCSLAYVSRTVCYDIRKTTYPARPGLNKRIQPAMAKKYVSTPVFDEKSFDAIQDDASIPQYVKDAAKHIPDFDASETMVFARQLETVRNQMYKIKYSELKGRQFVPFSEEFGMETEYVTFRVWDGTTLTMLVSNYATDFPLVAQSAKEYTVRFHEFGNSYGYNLLELRRAAKLGVSLKLDGQARKGHELAFDDEIAFGVPQLKTFGLLNNPNVPVVTTTGGTWASATGLAKLKDLNDIVTTQMVNTDEVEKGDTLLMSVAAYRNIATSYVDAGATNQSTVLEAFKAQNPGITVATWNKLATAGATGGGRMVFYRRSSEILEFLVGKEFEVQPAVQQGMMIQFPCISRAAGVSIYYPMGVSYTDTQVI